MWFLKMHVAFAQTKMTEVKMTREEKTRKKE
jgi:hypothetical protein